MSLHGDRVDLLRDAARRALREAGLPSCQYALALAGEVVVSETLGEAPPDARFLLFSATKPIVASVVWQLIGEGRLDPAAPVADRWPEFARNGKPDVTLEQVMLHTAGFPNATLSREAWNDRAARVREIEGWTLEWEPGTKYEYHGLSAHWVLAELITRATGQDHRVATRERVLGPLGLTRLELGVESERRAPVQPIVVTGQLPPPAAIREFLGIDPADLPTTASTGDLLASVREPAFLEAGVPGAGAVSDAANLALFYQALLHDRKGVWDPDVLHDATTNVRNRMPDVLGRAAMRTLGCETAGNDDRAHMRIGAGATSAATFGHGGAGGQVAWADPASGLSFVFLTNGFDLDFIREYRRSAALTTLAAACGG